MTSADLDHNDKLLAAGKKEKLEWEKLEWVTPKISLSAARQTLGKQAEIRPTEYTTYIGPS